jgi:hypothetical protein
MAGVRTVAAQAADNPSAGDSQVVTLDRAGCPGGCAAYSVRIDHQGHVQFTYRSMRPRVSGSDTLRPGAVRSYTVDEQLAADLFRQIDRGGFFEIATNWTMRGRTAGAPCPTRH